MVFPQPEAPITAVVLPGWNSALNPSSAEIPPNRFVTPSARSRAGELSGSRSLLQRNAFFPETARTASPTRNINSFSLSQLRSITAMVHAKRSAVSRYTFAS